MVTATDRAPRRAVPVADARFQRLAEIGEVAASVAHDVNNMMQVILGTLDVEERCDVAGDDLHGVLREAAEHTADLSRRILTFSRGADCGAPTVGLGAHLRDLAQLCGHSFRPHIDIRVTVVEDASVACDEVDLTRVVLNLLVNARDAIREARADTGIIDITVDVARRQDGGGCALIRVTDDGAGMDPATRRHAFDADFTTRPDSTGLGLPTVLDIVRRAGGWIECASDPGAGTTFTVCLPLHPDGSP